MIDDPVHEAVHRALAEDLGSGEDSDLTTTAIVPPDARGRARLIAKEDAVLFGAQAFELSFQELDNDVTVRWEAKEGDRVHAGEIVATVEGNLRAILTAERTALNCIQRGSGVATHTRRFVDAAGGTPVRDTRKTIPGIREGQKMAVRAGGGVNHRMGLHDGILIKDNHVAFAGSVTEAIRRVRAAYPSMWIEVECDTLDQVKEALDAGAHELLLDNMDLETMTQAVNLAEGRAKTEASGGVTLETIGAIARTGVDSISVGAITHSAPAADFSLEVEPDAPRG